MIGQLSAGVIGRRYHADFRATLRKAMRNSNGFIRAQAAAVASRLNADEKSRLWSTAAARAEGHDQRPDQDGKAVIADGAAVWQRRP